MTPDDILSEAGRVRAEHARHATTIRDSAELSDAGKRSRLAALRRDTGERLSRLGAEFRAARGAHQEELFRAAFGASAAKDPASLVAMRDALDRAERARSPREVVALIERAHASGDQMLARAAAAGAWRRQMPEAVRRYTDLYPGQREAVAELVEATRSESGTERMHQRAHFSVPPDPAMRQAPAASRALNPRGGTAAVAGLGAGYAGGPGREG